MTFEQIITDLKNKIYYPVYFLTGEEPYYIDQIADYIEENVLTETEKELNQAVIYGRETDIPTIISYVKRYPMMATYQVVIIKEAQGIDKIEELENYITNPLKSTILVVCYKYKKIDKRKTIAKAITKNGILFESAKLYDNKIPAWITDYLKRKNYTISPLAAALLSEYLGTDLSKIANELTKLIINVPEKTEITPRHVEQNIGISKDFNVFELQKAFGRKDILKTNQIINHFANNPKEYPLVKTIIILFGFFNKVLIYHKLSDKSRNNAAAALSINPFFLNDYQDAARNYSDRKIVSIFSLLRQYDMKSKGVDNASASEGELLKELTYRILH